MKVPKLRLWPAVVLGIAFLLAGCAREAAETAGAESHVIGEFVVIYQMPELPTGCEITAATMVLNYYGFSADKVEMAVNYLPTLASTGRYYGEDGLLYGNDLYMYFLGDPETEGGYVCGAGAIVTALNAYLADQGASLQAVDKTGALASELYELVSRDIPVIVWCTIGMTERNVVQGWYTERGTYVDWATNDHGAVLIGYSAETVTIADPISGKVEYAREQFESVFVSRSSQCVVLEASP